MQKQSIFCDDEYDVNRDYETYKCVSCGVEQNETRIVFEEDNSDTARCFLCNSLVEPI